MDGWRQVNNWARDREGSIHHDATARAKGFPAGLVPGDVHVALVTAAVVERFGPAWYERGWLRHTFVAPAYNDEELRVSLQPVSDGGGDDAVDAADAAGTVDFSVDRRDGAVICAGRAGVCPEGSPLVPPWAQPDAPPPRTLGGADPLPHEPIGTQYGDRTPQPELGAFDGSLRGNDDSLWYRTASPWGEPIVPTVGPFSLAHRIRPTPAPAAITKEMQSGMNAGFEALHAGPLFYGRRYLRKARLVEKGVTGRYAFRTVEFSLQDIDARGDQPRFWGRWRIKWVTSTPSTASASST